MGQCATCGNEYEETFTVTMEDVEHEFDCFECAVQKLAPRCASCACRIIGHGVEAGSRLFCCAHCARSAGVEVLRDSA
ncbi:MAG: hypothetical protein ACF8R7_09535 [Phycisphaerales bacterium JB039]